MWEPDSIRSIVNFDMTRRRDRVNYTLRRELGALIPSVVSDPRLAPITSVTRAEVSQDLKEARVFITVLGERASEAASLAALQSASGMLQKALESRIRMRRVPHLVFQIDTELSDGAEVLTLMDQLADKYRDRTSSPDEV